MSDPSPTVAASPSVAAPTGAPNMPYAAGSVAPEPSLTRGVVSEVKEGMIVLSLPGTDYRMHLVCETDLTDRSGKRVTGVIRAQAKRVDVVQQGGRYLEPLYGRPRRVQGRVVATDSQSNSLVVSCGCNLTAGLMSGQSVSDFKLGDLVSFDIERGARFEPQSTSA